MPDLLDFQPSQELAKPPEPSEPTSVFGWVDQGAFALQDAANSEWIIPWAWRQIDRAKRAVEPDFKLTPELMKQLGDGLPDELLDQFSNATSLDQAWLIRQQQLSVQQSRQRLAELGATGTVLRIGAAIADPVAIAATLATAGVGGEAIYGARLTALQRLVRGGLVAAGTELPLSGYLASQDPEFDASDVLWSAGAAMFIGGGVNAWLGSGLDKAGRKIQKASEFEAFNARMIDRYGMTEKGKKYFAQQLNGQADLAAAARISQNSEIGAEAAETLEFMNSQRIPDVVYNGVDLNFRDVSDAPGGRLGMLRFGIAGRLGQSNIPAVRRLGRMLVEDVLPTADGKPVTFSASEWVQQERRMRVARFFRDTLNNFGEWAKDVPLMRRQAAMDDFYTQVGLAARDVAPHADPHIANAVKVMRREQDELLQLAKRYGVKGFENIEGAANYVPRIFNRSAIAKAISTHGPAEVTRLIAESMMKRSGHLDLEKATKLARGYLKIIQDTKRYSDISKARVFQPDQHQALQRILKEVGGLSDDDIADVLFAAVKRDGDRGVPARAKARVDLDEQHAISTPSGDLKITDLFENNSATLMDMYARQITGHSAMAEVMRSVQTSADDVVETWDDLITRMRDETAAAGLSPKQLRKAERDLNRLDIVHRHIMGLPMDGDPLASEIMRTARAFNHVRIMGQAGFAQLSETGLIIANAGLKATMQSVPMLGSIFRRAKNGEMSVKLLREIESLGIGTEALRHQIISRFDSAEAAAEFSGSRLSRALDRGVRFTNNVSFMVPIMIAQQRMAAVAAVQNWVNMAVKGKFPSTQRLASMGITEADARSIGAEMLKHSKRSRSGTVTEINLDQWDQFAASKFITALDKWSRRVIQSNDIGQFTGWMSKDWGRVLIQMRGFVIAAWEKQFLFNLQMRDWQAFTGLAWSMTFAGLAYTGQQYVASIGKPDREKFLKENLSTSRIAGAAWARSGYSSLIPDMSEYLAGVDLGGSPFLTPDSFTGNPTETMLRDFWKLRRAAAQSIGGDGITQRDGKAMARLIPAQNYIGVKNFIDAMVNQLPEDE